MSDACQKECKPPCYGDLQVVFPLGADGLRHTPAACMACDHKTPCLRQAVTRPGGQEVHEESLKRAYDAGMIGFMERWSRQKRIHKQRARVCATERPWRRWFKKGPARQIDHK